MKNRSILFITLLFVISTPLLSADSSFPLKPEFRLSKNSYNQNELYDTFFNGPQFKEFTKSYTSYTPELRTFVLKSLSKQASKKGFSAKKLTQLIESTGEIEDNNISTPFLIEKAKYNGKPVLIICFVWGNDAVNDFGHINLYVIDIKSRERLFFDTCR